VLDRSPLPANSSIRDFQHRKAKYVADAVEQALILPGDIVDLRTMKRHEVFLGLKRDLAIVSLSRRAPLLLLFYYIYIYIYLFIFCLCSLLYFLCRLFKLFLGLRSW